MNLIEILVDFNNRDKDGFLRMNLMGTTEDIAKYKINPLPGFQFLGCDGDLLVKIAIVEAGDEGILRGKIISDIIELTRFSGETFRIIGICKKIGFAEPLQRKKCRKTSGHHHRSEIGSPRRYSASQRGVQNVLL